MNIITREEIKNAIVDRRKQYKANLKSYTKKIRERFSIYQKMLVRGVDLSEVESVFSLESWNGFKIAKVQDFAKIKRIVGSLTEVEKSVENADENKVKVTLKPISEKFKQIRFSYVTTLPANAKCKIVRSTSEYTSLVCSR